MTEPESSQIQNDEMAKLREAYLEGINKRMQSWQENFTQYFSNYVTELNKKRDEMLSFMTEYQKAIDAHIKKVHEVTNKTIDENFKTEQQ